MNTTQEPTINQHNSDVNVDNVNIDNNQTVNDVNVTDLSNAAQSMQFINNNQAFIDINSNHNNKLNMNMNINMNMGTINENKPEMIPPPFRVSIDENQPLSLEEKKQLRIDLLNLPPEKLGDVMSVLKRNLPNQIMQNSDELVLDLKNLDTQILRHLQRYVHAIYLQIKSTLYPQPFYYQTYQPFMQQQLSMYGAQNAISEQRRLSENGQKRKRRSSFNMEQKAQMIDFWSKLDWEPCNDELRLVQTAQNIGVTVPQLKIFRQNNRKRKLSFRKQ